MKKYVAILRGINVGGHRKLLMAGLKTHLTKVGLKNVSTYIQSGNVSFESDLKPNEIENLITFTIKNKYGYNVPVIVRNHKELLALVNGNPYLNSVGGQIELLYVTFFKSVPEKDKVTAFNELTFDGDEFSLMDQHAYLKYMTKSSNSKLSNNIMESRLKVTCTSRNWKTCLKLLEMGVGE
ncbi:MAG: hypothetical protein ACI9AT_001030 [Ulvibacter sp.]|jgi:uncharacterized protein (DUF1697 family)